MLLIWQLLHKLLLVLPIVRWLIRFNRISSGAPGLVRHDSFAFIDRLQGDAGRSRAFMHYSRVYRVLILLGLLYQSIVTSLVCGLDKGHLIVLIVMLLQLPISVGWLVQRSEILGDLYVVQRVIIWRHQILSVLSISQSKEVCFGVETTIWYWLIALLSIWLLYRRSRFLVVWLRQPDCVSVLSSDLSSTGVDKVCLIASHVRCWLQFRLLRVRVKLGLCHCCHNMVWPWK